MFEQRPHGHPPIQESQHAPHEGGNDAPGLPPTLHEWANPPPEKSALNRAVERTRDFYEQNGWVFLPLGEADKSFPRLPVNPAPEQPRSQPESSTNPPPAPLEFQASQQPQNQDKMSEREFDREVTINLAHRIEDETMARIKSANTAQSFQPAKKPANSPEEIAAQKREQEEIDESIEKLRNFRIMSQRISYVQDLQPEERDKLRQRDPDFIDPILKGLEERPAREGKRDRLLYRITEGDMSGKKINYGRLGQAAFFSPQWENSVPEQYHDQIEEAILDLRDVLLETEQKRNDRKAEITGVTNAICCAHDLLSIFKEAEAPPLKIYTRIHRRLEKRRAYLDPDQR